MFQLEVTEIKTIIFQNYISKAFDKTFTQFTARDFQSTFPEKWPNYYFLEYDRFSARNISESHEFVGNKAKGQISKRVLQENKARQIFQ